jgi:alpha-glucosidase (family GH31 glycosyl hydrolase)
MPTNKLRVVHVTPVPRIENWAGGEVWRGVDEIHIALDEAHWYGGGGLVHQAYPLERLAQYNAPFLTSDNGATGLLGILHPLWFNSDGAGVEVLDTDNFEMSFNAPLTGQAHAHSFTQPAPFEERPRLAEGLETDGLLKLKGEKLTLRFYAYDDPRQLVEAFWTTFCRPSPPPPRYFEKTLWTTWAQFKNDITAEKVRAFAEAFQRYGFGAGVLGIDAKWQEEFGSTRFDPLKFPDAPALMRTLHVLGLEVTLWCIPFFNQASQHFQTAIQRGYVLKNADGSPYISDWWEGQAAYLDVTNPQALAWHLDNLTALAQSAGVDGFKFDAGEGMFYQREGVMAAGNRATRAYIQALSERYPWSDIRAGWFTQDRPMLYRQWDKSTTWSYANGLPSVITGAITLNLLGYPFSFPDMVGGNAYGGQKPTAELLIRWTQAVAPMPIIQFSLAPWEQGEECAQLCARYARLHAELASHHRTQAEADKPLVRPLWWLDPRDEACLTCADSYLIGETLLVAPVIQEGARQRDIYLPSGTWRSYWKPDEKHQGGWLRDYPAPLDILPLFVKEES